MMRCARFERLAALALGAGARILQAGNGAFVAQHQGQRFQLRNLAEVAGWLAAVNPQRQSDIAHAAKRTAKLKGASKRAAGVRP